MNIVSKRSLWTILCVLIISLLTACSSNISTDQSNNNNTECTHTFGVWSTVNESTCTEEGLENRVCEKCGHEESKTISKKKHSIETIPAVPASCNETGLSEGKVCTICNEIIIKQKETPAEHLLTEETTVKATCSQVGEKTLLCSVCGYTYTEELPKTNHDFSIIESILAPTCTTDGSEKQICSMCNEEKTVSIKKTGHSPTSNNYCSVCKEALPVTLNLSNAEIQKAKSVAWISERTVTELEDEGRIRVMFSLLDDNKQAIAVPVLVEIIITNDNGEAVYKAIKKVSSSDFTTWSNAYGKSWFAAAVYVDYDEIEAGSNKKGKLSFRVYNDYVSFAEESFSLYDPLPVKKSSVVLPSLPATIHDYGIWDDIDTTVIITNITYEIDEDDLVLYFTGEKTYDSKGNSYSRSCQVGWKLYDSENYIVDSGTFFSPQIAVGEKFRDETENAYGVIKPGMTYTLKITNVD